MNEKTKTQPPTFVLRQLPPEVPALLQGCSSGDAAPMHPPGETNPLDADGKVIGDLKDE